MKNNYILHLREKFSNPGDAMHYTQCLRDTNEKKNSHFRRADAISAHNTYAQLDTVIFFQYYTNAVHISSC